LSTEIHEEIKRKSEEDLSVSPISNMSGNGVIGYLNWKELTPSELDEYSKKHKVQNSKYMELDKQRHNRGSEIFNYNYESWRALNKDDREAFYVVNKDKAIEYFKREKQDKDAEEPGKRAAALIAEQKRIEDEKKADEDRKKAEQDQLQHNIDQGSVSPNQGGGDTVLFAAIPSPPGGVPPGEFQKLLQIATQYAQTMVRKFEIPYDKLDQTKQVDLIKAALSCILNGPFNPHNKTNFGDKEYSIESCFNGAKFSNNVWKEFCRPIAVFLKSRFGLIDCNMRRRIGDYWPLAEYVSQKKSTK